MNFVCLSYFKKVVGVWLSGCSFTRTKAEFFQIESCVRIEKLPSNGINIRCNEVLDFMYNRRSDIVIVAHFNQICSGLNIG